ncbi:unnamed protein product [Paramecium octaurelia]|uniref:Phosphatidylinositol-glycan biosynthesis class X protein n=1 Tax=Paramecium octaurelia TaxID=43137 RepID=A0A8S1YC38_PAROT|nr:unnamed protein product [Paramecium octaurelia]
MFILALFSFVSSQIIIGQLPSSINEQLTIKVDTKSIRIRYCLLSDQYNNGLKKNEFNYPNPKTFTQLNQKLLLQYITNEIFNQMESKSALFHHENWRCKQYTIYDYFPELFEISNNNAKNRILTILKSEKQDAGEFKQSQDWTYQLQINSNTQQQQIQIKYKNESSGPKYHYERKLIGAGLHQFIETKIIFDKQPSQNVVIVDELDTFTYVDKDELDKLPYEAKLMTIVDIERPNELSTQHIILSQHKGALEITYLMPYHFRYHLASDTHYKTSYVPNIPRVYLESQSGDPLIKSFFNGNYEEAQISTYKEHLTYQIPVGYLPYKNVVSVITIGITLGMALHISNLIRKDKQ